MECFASRQDLPCRFGHALDERAVEYPWFLAGLPHHPGRLLDLGSTLNFEFLLNQPALGQKDITIATLEPEDVCFWQRRVSYVYCDARDMPFKDDYFDEVVSISTLEHVGFDNTFYYSQNTARKEKDSQAYLTAVKETRRILKPGGTVFVTVPFGRAVDYEWYQQFDKGMVEQLVEACQPAQWAATYFRYERGGWRFSNCEECQDCVGFHNYDRTPSEEDLPVASMAVAALEIRKPG